MKPKTVAAAIVVPGPVDAVEELWFDPARWPSWIDGFGHVQRVGEGWPEAGSDLVWDSRPGGRGRVLEKVVSRIAGDGVTSAVEDGQIRGTQGVTFSATDDDAVRVGVALEYELKEPPSWPLAGLFIKRAMAESLRRTLARFAIERSADAG